jgi:asparagine synthase (glutamine-hydrolysing)
MAGIAGAFVDHVGSDLPARIRIMTGCITSSLNEMKGLHIEPKLRAALGWSGLAPGGTLQLTWNRKRDIGLYLNGEVYPESSSSSSEHFLENYEQTGINALAELNGHLSGVIVDRRKQEAHVFNDRYGLARIYYHQSGRDFFFASEAKSLLRLLPHLRRFDQNGLAEFLSLGCVLQNRTLFEGISLLPPASVWTYSNTGKIEKQRYFDPRHWEQQEPLSAEEYSVRLCELFSRNCSKYFMGSAPVALSLTGGLDSRMILAWARASPGTLPCYTFGGPYRDCADVRIAKRLANICKQPHTTIRISADFFDRFRALAENTVYITDGAMDVSGAVELYVNECARQIAPVRVTGNYGSEILRSNVAFGPRSIDTSLFTTEFRRLIDGASETYRAEAVGHRLSFIAFKQVSWYHFGRYAVERSQLNPRSPYLDNELVALAYRAPRKLVDSVEPLLQLIANGNPALGAVGSDRALRFRTNPILGALKHTWQEFTAKAEYAYDYGMPRWLVRTDQALKPLHLEKVFLGRHKFYHFRVWYRDQLAHALLDELSLKEQPSCYVDHVAKRIVKEHISGRVNRTLDIHKLLTVQIVERSLFTS